MLGMGDQKFDNPSSRWHSLQERVNKIQTHTRRWHRWWWFSFPGQAVIAVIMIGISLTDLYDRSDQRDISQLFGNLFWDSPMESFHIIYIPRQLITLHHSSSYHSWIMMKCVLISCHPFPCDTYKTYLCISILLLFFLFWIWNKFILASS